MMNTPRPTLVQEIAEAVVSFQRRTTDHAPRAITVVLTQDTLVVLLHEALSPAEKALSQRPTGVTQVREFHRQLFATASAELKADIRRITGVEWPQAVAEVEPMTGDVVQAFTRTAAAQVLRQAVGEVGKSPPVTTHGTQ